MGLPFGLQGISCLRHKSLSRTEPSNDDDSPHPYHFVFSDRRATNPRINRSNSTQSILSFRSINTSLMISFHLPLFLLLYMMIALLRTKKTLEPLKSQADEMKWEVSCLFRLWRKSHVLQRCLSKSPWNSVTLPTHQFLGGSEPDKEDTYWPENAPHWRTGTSILQKVVSTISPKNITLFFIFLCDLLFFASNQFEAHESLMIFIKVYLILSLIP